MVRIKDEADDVGHVAEVLFCSNPSVAPSSPLRRTFDNCPINCPWYHILPVLGLCVMRYALSRHFTASLPTFEQKSMHYDIYAVLSNAL
jgi:hypothetical protein